MKIVFICNEYPLHSSSGGIGVFTRTIAHGLIGSGHDVTVLGYGKKAGHWDDGGVKVVLLQESTVRGVAWLVNRWRLYNWLKRHSRSRAIDIIEVPEYQGMLPFKFPWCPVVVRLHTPFAAKQRIQFFLEKRTLRLHPNWIAVSEWIGRETQKRYHLKPLHMPVVYNPVKISLQTLQVPFALPTPFVLYAGTVSERKGAFVLAEAAHTFLSSFQDLHLLYVGGLTIENGCRADETIRQILGDRLVERVHFTGPVPHDVVLACMRKARVFAFPSKLEAFGLVPAEAMACGVPVVYSTLHAGPEVIVDGVTGLLADPNSPTDVAEKVMRFLNDQPFSERLGKNAKKAVEERFSLKQCVDQTVVFYADCLTMNGKLK